MKLIVHDREGQRVELEDVKAPTLMLAIRDAGMNLTAQCGGCASCATCHVYVDEAWRPRLEPIADVEDAMLELVEERKESSRLSCQVALTEELDGLTVTIAPNAEF
ncbi:2Fe-2S iron-sulfur cluster-binding protein [Burkholderia cepacia]|uniref:2Fe-2S iron-sulfur cluster-binding protein n=1 Tax=Burkholderia cepacia TaxID=292 RepID=UPI002AB73B80|nr:2Fe-2S iron-sulfur cluster-binding protein [Burkholderia cepacia]